MTTTPALNIIGCGRLGRTLGRLWRDNHCAEIGGISNRSQDSAADACKFIGSGQPTQRINDLPAAELWLIATPDNEIASTAQQLADTGVVNRDATVFHCSGSLPAAALSPLAKQGIQTASIHPVHSFADPQRSLQSFTGTFCAMEGHSAALNRLKPLFQTIGGRTFELSADNKPLYHAATAVASNFLVTLMDTALTLLEQSGLPRDQARELILPIVLQTAQNVGANDSVAALTGPITRGDVSTIHHHLDAIALKSPENLQLYKLLGQHTLPLAEQQGTATPEQLEQLSTVLRKS